MRTSATLTHLVFAASVLSYGCADSSTCADGWCGTVVVTSPAEADILMPPVAQSDVARSIVDLVFLKLADIGPQLHTVDTASFVPKLASSWAFEDPRTLVFTLNTRARWHDGMPVTAADVVFTFAVYRDTLVASPARPRLTRIDSVTARDTATVAFHFAKPYPEQLFDAVYHLWIIPKHLLDTVPRTAFASHAFGRAPIGAGPYRFANWVAGQSLELQGNAAFHDGRPGIRRVIWRFAGNPDAALSQLLAGEADLFRYLTPEAQQQVDEDEDLTRVPYLSSTIYNYMVFNLRHADDAAQPHPLFADARLRRAITMGVDREAIVRAVDGPAGATASGPLSPAYWISDGDHVRLPFDSAEARRALGELGWHDSDGDGILDRGGTPLSFGVTLPVTSTQRRRMAIIAQEQLRRLGIDVRLVELDFGTFLAQADAGTFDVLFGSYGGDPSPSAIAEVWSGAAIGGYNYGRYENPAFDRAVSSAIDATDVASARAFWTEALSIINEDAAAIWLSATIPVAGVHRRLQDVTIRGDNATATLPQWSVTAPDMIARDRVAP
jgi:peptide/nickel transport system substrate-binding protein